MLDLKIWKTLRSLECALGWSLGYFTFHFQFCFHYDALQVGLRNAYFCSCIQDTYRRKIRMNLPHASKTPPQIYQQFMDPFQVYFFFLDKKNKTSKLVKAVHICAGGGGVSRRVLFLSPMGKVQKRFGVWFLLFTKRTGSWVVQLENERATPQYGKRARENPMLRDFFFGLSFSCVDIHRSSLSNLVLECLWSLFRFTEHPKCG